MEKPEKVKISEESFLDAIKEGNLDKVKSLLGSNKELIKTGSSSGNTVFHLAVKKGYLEIVNYLIQQGSEILGKDGLKLLITEADSVRSDSLFDTLDRMDTDKYTEIGNLRKILSEPDSKEYLEKKKETEENKAWLGLDMVLKNSNNEDEKIGKGIENSKKESEMLMSSANKPTPTEEIHQFISKMKINVDKLEKIQRNSVASLTDPVVINQRSELFRDLRAIYKDMSSKARSGIDNMSKLNHKLIASYQFSTFDKFIDKITGTADRDPNCLDTATNNLRDMYNHFTEESKISSSEGKWKSSSPRPGGWPINEDKGEEKTASTQSKIVLNVMHSSSESEEKRKAKEDKTDEQNETKSTSFQRP